MGIPRVRLSESWISRDTATGLDEDLADALFRHRMSPSRALAAPTTQVPTTSMELWGGSQRTMWLFGALFVDSVTLPRTGILIRTLQSEGNHVERIEFRLEDNIGFGVMDPFSGWRFKRLFRRIATDVEEAIKSNSSTVGDAPPIGM
jgi:hypothetical protein